MVGPLRHADVDGDYLTLAADALVAAARDAGLPRETIDGLVINSGGEAGPDYDQLATYLGLQPRTCLQSWAHGRFSASVVQQAALLVDNQHADVVACIYARRLGTDTVGGPAWKGWSEELRKGGGPHGENPRIGLTAPLGTAALAARLYANRYRTDLAELFHVVADARLNAAAYPGALRPQPIDRDAYLDNPYIVEPLRRWDCTPRTEGAVCILVARAERAATASRTVEIAGFDGIPAGSGEFIWSRPGLGVADQSMLEDVPPDRTVFERSGIEPADVDVFFTYDAFSPLVWFALERYGYCPAGAAPGFVQERGLTYHGGFPTNPHGGSLATGQLAGWLHLVEAVVQLRHEAGARQVPDARLAHYGSCYGDSMIFRRSG
ncbi:MAG: hypothetical protein GEV12_15460 [Micromonosporaceae bacterium]|nr:hypothetical protein [Micromonosporaceae bacterium]